MPDRRLNHRRYGGWKRFAMYTLAGSFHWLPINCTRNSSRAISYILYANYRKTRKYYSVTHRDPHGRQRVERARIKHASWSILSNNNRKHGEIVHSRDIIPFVGILITPIKHRISAARTPTRASCIALSLSLSLSLARDDNSLTVIAVISRRRLLARVLFSTPIYPVRSWPEFFPQFPATLRPTSLNFVALPSVHQAQPRSGTPSGLPSRQCPRDDSSLARSLVLLADLSHDLSLKPFLPAVAPLIIGSRLRINMLRDELHYSPRTFLACVYLLTKRSLDSELDSLPVECNSTRLHSSSSKYYTW